MSFATSQHVAEWIDDYAADYPLEALRELADWLSDFRLDACACVEPLAALVYAGDRLTPERAAACYAAAEADGTLKRYVPDARAKERLASIRQMLNQLALAPRAEPVEFSPQPRRERTPRTQAGYVIACEVCGTEFRARRADARYCGGRCRQKASRAARVGSPGDDSQEAGTPARGDL